MKIANTSHKTAPAVLMALRWCRESLGTSTSVHRLTGGGFLTAGGKARPEEGTTRVSLSFPFIFVLPAGPGDVWVNWLSGASPLNLLVIRGLRHAVKPDLTGATGMGTAGGTAPSQPGTARGVRRRQTSRQKPLLARRPRAAQREKPRVLGCSLVPPRGEGGGVGVSCGGGPRPEGAAARWPCVKGGTAGPARVLAAGRCDRGLGRCWFAVGEGSTPALQ